LLLRRRRHLLLFCNYLLLFCIASTAQLLVWALLLLPLFQLCVAAAVGVGTTASTGVLHRDCCSAADVSAAAAAVLAVHGYCCCRFADGAPPTPPLQSSTCKHSPCSRLNAG
jgi:hypothetical protein